MNENDFWRLSAVEISRLTRAGDISVEQIIQSHVDRMARVNPQLNAVVEDLSEAALERARLLDVKRAAGGKLGPLHGVPVTIKINVDQAGSPTSNGVLAFKNANIITDIYMFEFNVISKV